MNNNNMNYQVPNSSAIKCSSYFKFTPLSKSCVDGYALYAQSEGSSVKKFGKYSELFHNELRSIRNNKETPSSVKRFIDSILQKFPKPTKLLQLALKTDTLIVLYPPQEMRVSFLTHQHQTRNSNSSDLTISENVATHTKAPDAFTLNNLFQDFKPITLGEQLDVMAAKLALSIDLSDIVQVNALKLSLSRIIDTVNNDVMSIFRQYLNDQSWKKLNNIEGIPTTTKELYCEMMAGGTINGKINKKELRIAIAKKKLELLKSDQIECLQILDILDLTAKHCLPDRSICSDDNASELTYYRQFAKILDEILDDTMLDILDGERVSDASKTGIKLSASEWKRKKSPTANCLQQQAKSIRINKAILRHFLNLPIPEADKDNGGWMDWVGNVEYMFAIKPLEDAFVARTLFTLATPIYTDELPSFLDTLDHLYSWRNYHLCIKDIILKALAEREKEKLFSSIRALYAYIMDERYLSDLQFSRQLK
ncbi:hypothetical protein BDF20DRAFT_1004608 [Mycotypha africana]|uniref:uncharacterized protein n=1 Tax=Mycotypha africana TaxID=64632 RepID=UPI002301719F|nr:uncharacterized protein BDF20DRAFT_1004608 [Mycotypha africana]KAI8967740.1 hypothetical protein BDF20DRAFT_1004608 [Mycotypha africana]